MTQSPVVNVVRALEPWGTQRQLLAVAAAAQQAGLCNIVVCVRGGTIADALQEAGVEVVTVGGDDNPSLAAVARVQRAVVATRPGVVHLWDDWSLRHIGPILALRRQVPYFCSFRNPPPQLTWLRRAIVRRVLRRAAGIVSPSDILREDALSVFGQGASLRDKWHVVRDDVVVPDAGLNRAELLATLDLPTNVRYIATASRFTVEKSLRDTLFATALLRMAHDDLRLVVCGDGPHAAEVRRFCRSMEIDDITTFTGIRDDAAEVIRHAEAYVDAAVVDGPSRGIAEARRLGVPVVCVDSAIRREQIGGDGNALFAPPHDPGALTRQIHSLLINTASRTERMEQVKDDTAIGVEAYEALYRRFLST
jgi:glycosyltransferase involved in cell wall biosynthesis